MKRRRPSKPGRTRTMLGTVASLVAALFAPLAQAAGGYPAAAPQPSPAQAAPAYPSPPPEGYGVTGPATATPAPVAPNPATPPLAGAPLPAQREDPDERGARLGNDGTPHPFVILQASNPRARLQVKQAAWRDVCTMPCRIPVPAAGFYRVGGGGSRASESFLLPRRSDPPVVIDAHLGSVAKFWVGVGLLAGGLGAVASGALTYSNAPAETNYSSASQDQRTVDHAVGTISMVGGGVVALVGLVLLASNGSSVEVR